MWASKLHLTYQPQPSFLILTLLPNLHLYPPTKPPPSYLTSTLLLHLHPPPQALSFSPTSTFFPNIHPSPQPPPTSLPFSFILLSDLHLTSTILPNINLHSPHQLPYNVTLLPALVLTSTLFLQIPSDLVPTCHLPHAEYCAQFY